MSKEATLAIIARQYLPIHHWGPVESKILTQNRALAAPIIPADELMDATISSGLLALSEAIGNLTHQLELDRPVYWCVSRAKVVNAMIAGYRSPDMYVVVVGEGMLNAVFYFCAAIMTSEPLARFLAENVDPVDEMKSAERSRREAWAKISDEADDRSTRESVGRAFPIHFLAMHFLMAHEVAHLAGGHLPLFAGAFTAEADGTGRPDKAENRALERDADALAAGATMYLLGNPEFALSWSDYLTDREAGLRYFLTTAYVLYSVMDLFGPEDPFAEERTHPPAMVRVSTTTTMLARLLDQYGGFKKDESWEIGRRAVRAVEIAVMELGGGMMAPDEAERLEAVAQQNLIEHAQLWPGLKARMDRRHLEKYWWSQPLR